MRLTICILLFLAASPTLSALEPDRPIAEFLHTAWAVTDGAPSGVHEFAQTTDGYLWLGSTTGLFRFDGVRFERYEPKRGESLQFREISALLATADGGLWIGRAGRAIFLKEDRAVVYGRSEGFPVSTVFRFVADGQGTIWAATSRGLKRFANSGWDAIGADWNFSAESATDAFVDTRGYLRVTAPGELFSLAPDTQSFKVRKTTGPWLIREAPDRTLWMSEYGVGIRAVNGPLADVHDVSKPTLALAGGPYEVLPDRAGGVWFTDRGVARLDPASGLIERFTQENGLTAATAIAALEDREGNVWVATTAGIDRFRRRNIVPGPFPFGPEPLALVTDNTGTVLAASGQSLMQLQHGQVSVRTTFQMPKGYQSTRGGVRSTYRDPDGVVWLGGHGVLTRVDGRTAENIELPRQVRSDSQWDVQAITRDRTGDLWVSIQQHGVFRRHDSVWLPLDPEDRLGPGGAPITPITLWTDVNGRIWSGYAGSRIVMHDGPATRTYSSEELQIGTVTYIGGQGDRMWLVGQLGFALSDGDRFTTIANDADADFKGISGVVQTANGDFWLNQATGLAHIPAAEIAERIRDPHHKLRYELFDYRDGVPGSATTGQPLPAAVLAADGRIWMTGPNGTYWVDPARIYRNEVAPPVSIQAIYSDDQQYDPSHRFTLPALPSNVRIEYTALSLSMPERVRFRYQLEGAESGWQEAGTRRAAYYTRLPPGHFQFHVIASNNDGVWNTTGAAATIVVAPAFFQTTWFIGLCVCGAGGSLWAAYRLRLRQLSTRMNARLEERLGERTRIARELHDTLLQSFQGLMLRLQVVEDILPEGRAKHQLEQALERADRAIAEGRNAVHDLRSAATTTNDLGRAVQALGDELATDGAAAFQLVVEGRVKDLNPILRDEVYRITREALRNAFKHARAHHIEAEIAYGERALRVRIRDDGEGIQSDRLEAGRPGHYGLEGMRERARQVTGELEIWSRPGAGTEIDLTIPGSVAYSTSPGRGLSRLFQKRAG